MTSEKLQELRDKKQMEYERLRAQYRGEIPAPRYGLRAGDELLDRLCSNVWHEVRALDEALALERS